MSPYELKFNCTVYLKHDYGCDEFSVSHIGLDGFIKADKKILSAITKFLQNNIKAGSCAISEDSKGQDRMHFHIVKDDRYRFFLAKDLSVLEIDTRSSALGVTDMSPIAIRACLNNIINRVGEWKVEGDVYKWVNYV